MKTVKKIAPYIMMAVAVYFTAGLALSFTPAAGFAASMPGFASGGLTGALGSGTGVAGGGIFSSVASSMGLGGGLATGASTVAGTTITTGMLGNAAAITAATQGAAASSGVLATTGSATSFVNPATGDVVTSEGITAASQGTGSVLEETGVGFLQEKGKEEVIKAGLSTSDKLLAAAFGAKAIGAFLEPDPDELYREQKKFRGSFYGVDASGVGANTPAPGTNVPTGTPGIGLGDSQQNAAAPVAQTPGLRAGGDPLFATEGGSGPVDRAQFAGLDPLYPTTPGQAPSEPITKQRGITDANPFVAGVYG